MPVTITSVSTQGMTLSGKWIRQGKFENLDEFRIVVNFSVSPDLARTNLTYIFRTFWEGLGTESGVPVWGWMGHEIEGRLPFEGTAWQVAVEHRSWFLRNPGERAFYKGYVMIDILRINDMPAMSPEFVISVVS